MPTSSFSKDLAVTTDPDQCWQTLTDMPRLVSWVSLVDDAKELEPLKRYTAVLTDRLGPFSLRAELDINVTEVHVARHIRVQAAGEDRQVSSRIRVDARMSLDPLEDGRTQVSVSGTYEVVGRVATLGAGMIRKKADGVLREFFDHAAKELEGS